MYCDECDIVIPYNTDICPLCNKKISDDAILDNPIYPKRNSSFRFPAKYSFTLFYSAIAIIVFLIVLIVNIIIDRKILWAFIVGAGLIYTFALVRHTIITPYSSANKIFIQGIMLSFVILIVQNVTHTGTWAYDYVIPMVLVANTITLWTLALIRRDKRASYALTLMGISLLSIIPMIWYLASYSFVLWTAIVSLSTAIITLTLVLIIFRTLLVSELKKLLHI